MNKKVLMAIAGVVAALAMVLLILWALGLDNTPRIDTQQTTSTPDETTATIGSTLGENGVGELPQVTEPSDVTEPSAEGTQNDSTTPTTGGDEVTDPTKPSVGQDDENDPTQPPKDETQTTPPATEPGGTDPEPTNPSGPVQPPATQPPATEPPVTEPPVTEPAPTDPTEPERAPEDYTYEEYMAMTAAEKQAFFKRFESHKTFMQWYNDAYEAYEAAKNEIEVEGGEVNIGDYMGGDGNG